MDIKPLNNYSMYQKDNFKTAWTLEEIKSAIVHFENKKGFLPISIGMKKEDILWMGKISFGGKTDFLRGVSYKGQEIRVIPVKTCLKSNIQLYY